MKAPSPLAVALSSAAVAASIFSTSVPSDLLAGQMPFRQVSIDEKRMKTDASSIDDQ